MRRRGSVGVRGSVLRVRSDMSMVFGRIYPWILVGWVATTYWLYSNWYQVLVEVGGLDGDRGAMHILVVFKSI